MPARCSPPHSRLEFSFSFEKCKCCESHATATVLEGRQPSSLLNSNAQSNTSIKENRVSLQFVVVDLDKSSATIQNMNGSTLFFLAPTPARVIAANFHMLRRASGEHLQRSGGCAVVLLFSVIYVAQTVLCF